MVFIFEKHILKKIFIPESLPFIQFIFSSFPLKAEDYFMTILPSLSNFNDFKIDV